MDVRMPGGTIIRNVPDGITRAELSRRLGLAGISTGDQTAPEQPPAIPEPVIPRLTMEKPPGVGESMGRGALTQFLGNVLGLPDLAATSAAQVASSLTPREGTFGPLEAVAGALKAVSGGTVDPAAAAETVRTNAPVPGDRVLGLPTGEEANAVFEAAGTGTAALARGEELNFGPRVDRSLERTAQAETEHPLAFTAGEVAGDAATLMLAAPARARLRALEDGRAVLPPSKLPAGIRRQLDDFVRSNFMRTMERTGMRAAEAGIEGATLALLDEGDPVKTAALAAGGQVMGTAAIGLNKLLMGKGISDFLLRTGGTFFSMGALIQIMKEKIPGGQDRILESLEESGTGLATVMALGGIASMAGLDRHGGRFAENLPRLADAMTAIPRGAMISGFKDLAKAMSEDDGTIERTVTELVKNPEVFGPEVARRLDRAFRTGRLGKEIERLKNNPKFLKRLDELSE
ncbi:MAG: hypothetical protein RIB80_04590 [Rhodospirillales bacterium]